MAWKVFHGESCRQNVLACSSSITTLQCDQMARLFFQYLAIYNDEILPKSIQKSPKVGSQLWQISNKPFKSCQRFQIFAKLAKFCAIWSHCYLAQKVKVMGTWTRKKCRIIFKTKTELFHILTSRRDELEKWNSLLFSSKKCFCLKFDLNFMHKMHHDGHIQKQK